MIWADRLALVWALFMFMVIWFATNDTTSELIVDMLNPNKGLSVLPSLVLPVWIPLRLLDAIFGGPRHRAARRPAIRHQ